MRGRAGTAEKSCTLAIRQTGDPSAFFDRGLSFNTASIDSVAKTPCPSLFSSFFCFAFWLFFSFLSRACARECIKTLSIFQPFSVLDMPLPLCYIINAEWFIQFYLAPLSMCQHRRRFSICSRSKMARAGDFCRLLLPLRSFQAAGLRKRTYWLVPLLYGDL